MSLRYPHLASFRCTEEEWALVLDVVGSYPGMKVGTALRTFFTSPEVMQLIRERSHAFRVREALLAAAALRDLLEEDDELGPTPFAPPPRLAPGEPPAPLP